MKMKQLLASALMVAILHAPTDAALLLQHTFDEASGNALDTGAAPLTD